MIYMGAVPASQNSAGTIPVSVATSDTVAAKDTSAPSSSQQR